MQPDKFSAIVVGAGPAGLLTALELQRHGAARSIRILEKAAAFSSIGDAFALQPSALLTVQHYPQLCADVQAATVDAVVSLWKHTGGDGNDAYAGRVWGPEEAEWNCPGVQAPATGFRVGWMVSRSRFVRALLAEVARQGLVVEWGAAVAEYGDDAARGVAWVRVDGADTRHEADVVIAADGVGTMSHWAVTGHKTPSQSSGYAIFRVVMPTQVALASDEFRNNVGWKVGDRPEFRIYVAKHLHLNLVLSDTEVMYFLTHKDNGQAEEAWRQTVPLERVLEVINEMPGWDPAIIALMKQTPPDRIVDWKLMWRDPHEKWTSDSGRIIQIGDCAHSFLPTSGNGATQALEDALALAACLATGGRQGIPQATKAANLLRFERAATLQKLGVANRQVFHNLYDDDSGAISGERLQNPKHLVSNGTWLWAHNPVEYAQQNYDAAIAHLTTGKTFKNTNLPPGYKYEPWTMDQLLEEEGRGKLVDLKSQGEWNGGN